jgi:uncharacterized OB-fold protein
MRAVPDAVLDSSQAFWAAAGEGRLMLQACASCHELRHPPRPLCATCGSAERTMTAVSGRGTLYSYVLPRHPVAAGAPPRIAAIIALEEGPRIVSALVGAELDELTVDLLVDVEFETHEGRAQPVFRPRRQ